jgi:thiamine transport system substrate-binding protein
MSSGSFVESASAAPVALRPRRRRPGGLGRALIAIALALAVSLAVYAVYTLAILQRPGTPTLVVYTYSSLFGGSCGAPEYNAVFGAFGTSHGVHVSVECPGAQVSTSDLVSTLIAQKNSPRADLVIGLDEITAPEADRAGVLVPYASPQRAHIPPAIWSEISPDGAVTPYEWGYLAVDYCAGFARATHDSIAAASFPALAANAAWANNLLLESPTTDITGEEFLYWEALFYGDVLHENWTGWWKAVDSRATFEPSWDVAFGLFTCAASAPQLVSSYSTDPAYAANAGTPGAFNSTLLPWNGTEYGWRTVYGLGIVRGSSHLSLDREFVDWFLSGAVQSRLPTTEWEYPANASVALPPVYAWAIDPNRVVALNGFTTPNATAAALPGYLSEWQAIDNAYG